MVYIGGAIATLAVCTLGGYSMWLTQGATGIGWAIFGVFLIWVSVASI